MAANFTFQPVILYDANGVELSVQDGVAIPASTSALLVAGSDGSTARYLLVDSSGRQIVTGAKANNATAPGTSNLGVLSAVATVAVPSYTEGNQVGLSTDLAGSLRALAHQGTAAAVAGGWPIKVTDGTNTAAVKPANTASVAADPALVVTISPNSPVTVTTTPATSSTATLTNVTSSAASTTILASNASRKMAMIHNDSSKILYVKFGATASLTSYTVKLQPDGYFEFPVPVYTGVVDGIWAAANGAARVTELT